MRRALGQQHHGFFAQHDGEQHRRVGWLAVHELLLQHHLGLPTGWLRKTGAQRLWRLCLARYRWQVRIHAQHRHKAGIKIGKRREGRDHR
ncbi:hypothetical protein D3C71_1858910 [compost metagenome]